MPNYEINYQKYTYGYESAVKQLLLQLQEHLAQLDKRGVIVVKENYADAYFDYIMQEIKQHNGELFIATALSDDWDYGVYVLGMVVCKIFQGGGEEDITTSCPKIGFISDLVVSEGARGQGIGTRLIQEAENYFRKNNCDYTQLEVFAPNTDAFKLYKRLGFEVNCYYMSKKLT